VEKNTMYDNIFVLVEKGYGKLYSIYDDGPIVLKKKCNTTLL